MTPYVRDVGVVDGCDNGDLVVGVDYDSVVLRWPGYWERRLNSTQCEEFAQLFISAVWQAGENRRRMAEIEAVMPP